jgi:hypothetical protein
MRFDEGLECRTITVVTNLQADVPARAANHPGNRWSISLPRTMPTGFIGTAAGRVCWIGMFVAFFAGVLVQFIGFGHRIRQATEGGKPTSHHGLDGMSALQQMPTVNNEPCSQQLPNKACTGRLGLCAFLGIVLSYGGIPFSSFFLSSRR